LALFPHIAKGKGKGNRSVVYSIAASSATSPKRQFASTNHCFYAAVANAIAATNMDEASFIASKMSSIPLDRDPKTGIDKIRSKCRVRLAHTPCHKDKWKCWAAMTTSTTNHFVLELLSHAYGWS
jgi:hypothetical protein